MIPFLEYSLFALYFLIGPATWALFGAALLAGRRRIMLLERPVRALPEPAPRVSVLVPAKDEGERIRDCILSVLAQDYPNFEVIAVDDRSTDRTGHVLDELAADHPNLRVRHIAEGSLPEGWTGKCNALNSSVPDAGGKWFLFVDSDVILAPDALSATVARAASKRYALLSLLPKMECRTLWERLLVPLAATAISMMYLVSFTNRNRSPRSAFANGQYLFIRRDAYDAIGGHQAVRGQFCEDMEIARRVKGSGFKTRVAWGAGFATVRMYDSLSAIRRGWARIYFAAGVGETRRITLALLFVILCGFSLYPALGWGVYRLFSPGETILCALWLFAAAGHFLLMTLSLGVSYVWSGNPWWNALLFPLGGAMLAEIFIKALRMCATGRVEWRGTRYTHRIEPGEAKSGRRNWTWTDM